MYSWHTQHLAFHLSLLFSPLPMVIKATRTFTSFFAPPQHTAHTQHRKNWIGKKRNWKCTSIRTRLHCKFYSTFPKLPSIPRYSSLASLCTNTSRRAISAIFRWLIIEIWISTFNVGRWTKWFNLSSSDALFVFQGCISTGEEKMAAFLVYFRI